MESVPPPPVRLTATLKGDLDMSFARKRERVVRKKAVETASPLLLSLQQMQ